MSIRWLPAALVMAWCLACAGGTDHSTKKRPGKHAKSKRGKSKSKPRKSAPIKQVGPIAYGIAADIACPVCIANGPHMRTSSSLKGGYSASNAFDEDPTSAWCEGADGHGVGEWIELAWDQPMQIEGFEFVGGFAKNWTLMDKNSRIKAVTVSADGTDILKASFKDPMSYKSPTANDNTPIGYGDLYPAMWGPGLDHPVKSIRLTIDAVHEGSAYTDTCISTWSVYSYDPTQEGL